MRFSITTYMLLEPGLSNLALSMAQALDAAHTITPFKDLVQMQRWIGRAFNSPNVVTELNTEIGDLRVVFKNQNMLHITKGPDA
ncbi:MAG TPA: hypothetical protein PLB89_05310 [Flavobacteriales bacterium]|nr:hypothetical protein [Flavobacteriales bacterium]